MKGGIAGLVPAGRARLLIAATCLLSVLAAAVALVPPAMLYVVAVALVHRTADPSNVTILQFVFVILASVIVRLALLVFARVAGGSAAIIFSRSIRAAAAATIGALPLGILAERRPGELEATLLEDVATVSEFLEDRLVDLTGAYGMVLIALAVLFARDWRLAALSAALVLLVWGGFRIGSIGVRGRFAPERLARERLGAAIYQSVRSAALEQSLPPAGSAHPAAALVHAYRAATTSRFARAASARAQRRAFAGALPAIVVLAGLWLGGPNVDLSVIVLFAAIGVRASGALATVFIADTLIAPARASAARIRELLALPTMPAGDIEPSGPPSLRFSNVSFAYPGTGNARGPVLRDVSFVARAGAVTAIVGPSGSGKTTVTRLAARFWDVDGGAVELAGTDVRAIPLDWLMRQISFVFQDVALLDDSIAANLRLARPDAGDDDIIAAARAAAVHDFIESLPDGYATVIGDRGLCLSRGERQRLQIARALLKNAPILILDEPTASLDPATEAEIYDALAAFAAGKTVIVVTHRLSTVADAGSIVVLNEDGSVAASGSHAELLRSSELYARLWADYHTAFDPSGAAVAVAAQ